MAVDPNAAYGPAMGLTLFRALNPGLTARGLVAETMSPLANVGGTSVLIDGTALFVVVNLYQGQVITGAAIAVGAAGVTLTLSKLGLYTTSGTRVAVTADQGTAWESVGTKSANFTAPYTVPTTAAYYAAIITKGGTQPGVLRTGQSMANTAAGVGSGIQPYGVQTGQTDLPASATITTTASSLIIPWIGLI